MKSAFVHTGLILGILIPLWGCLRMGPDYQRPEPAFQVPATYENAPKTTGLLRPDDPWWEELGNPELNRFVDEALKSNYDIKRASAAVLELGYRRLQIRADRFPRTDFQGQLQRQRQSLSASRGFVPDLPGDTRKKGEIVDTGSVSFSAAFELDLWGRLARADEAAKADLLKAEENRRTVAQSVVAETVDLYLQMEATERRIEISQESIKSFKLSLDIVQGRYERGLSNVLDVSQARRILAEAEAVLPQLRQDLGIIQQRLFVLLGRYPETRPRSLHREDYFRQLKPVPPGLPSELLQRRPDVRAAEASLRSLNARVGVAKASRFPSISLTGNYGYASNALNTLFEPQSELYNLALGISQPLFDAGKLRAGQRAAEARYVQGVAEYAKTILTAFSEVEGSLLTRKEQLERRDRLVNFLNEARATQKVAQLRYLRGLVDYLNVLEAQRTRFQAEDRLVQTDLIILRNRVSLHRALGGGWAQLPPVGMGEGDSILFIFGR